MKKIKTASEMAKEKFPAFTDNCLPQTERMIIELAESFAAQFLPGTVVKNYIIPAEDNYVGVGEVCTDWCILFEGRVLVYKLSMESTIVYRNRTLLFDNLIDIFIFMSDNNFNLKP